MSLKFQAVCLNPYLTKVLEFAPLALIWLEGPRKLLSDTAIGLHR